MSRYTVTADTCTLTNAGGYTGSQSLVSASSVAQALGTKADSRYVRISLPYNATTSLNCDVVFTATLLPAIDATKKQSRWLRCVVAIRATSASGNSHSMRFICGTGSGSFADVTVGNGISNQTYTFLYPINGSNGGTTYWTGSNPLDVKFTIAQMRSNVNGVTATVDIDYVRFEYGEADDYIDVDATAAANRDAGLGGIAWTNPALSLSPDTDGASYGTSSTNSYSLDRTFPGLSIPGKYAGLEIWDSVKPNSYLNVLTLDLAHYPLSVPASGTPVYEMTWPRNRYDRPPTSVTPPGGGNNVTISGYWVWGGGPGDLWTDPDFGGVYNGWAGIVESRLTGSGLLVADIAGMSGGVAASTFLNRVFYRIFYDRVPGGGPLLLCEA
jgi:hypothetical protein